MIMYSKVNSNGNNNNKEGACLSLSLNNCQLHKQIYTHNLHINDPIRHGDDH